MTPPAQSTLANDLRQAAAIKAQMLELLGELEQTASAIRSKDRAPGDTTPSNGPPSI